MSEFIEIYWSCGSIDEARKISRYLVEERLVADAQIIPWIESIYKWNGQLETTQESKVILQTRKNLFDHVKQVILENCTYQLPEICYRTLDGGTEEYFAWMREATSATVAL